MTLNELIDRAIKLRDAGLGAGEGEVRLTQLPWSCRNASLGVHVEDPQGVHELYFFTESKDYHKKPEGRLPHFFRSETWEKSCEPR